MTNNANEVNIDLDLDDESMSELENVVAAEMGLSTNDENSEYDVKSLFGEEDSEDGSETEKDIESSETDDDDEEGDKSSQSVEELLAELEKAQAEADKFKALARKHENRAKKNLKQAQRKDAQKVNSGEDEDDEGKTSSLSVDELIEQAVLRAMTTVERRATEIASRAEFNSKVAAALENSAYTPEQRKTFINSLSFEGVTKEDGTLDTEKLADLLSIIPKKTEKKNLNLGQGRSNIRHDDDADEWEWLKG